MDFGEVSDLLQRLGIALGLGLIVGLQRERSGSPMGGFRTFPLAALFGSICGLLAVELNGWILAAGMVVVGALLVMANVEHRERDAGLTTEIAMLLMFVIGAFVMVGPISIAVITGGTLAVLLHFKPEMHSIARRLEDPDFRAIMQFVLITLVILPILPNQKFGPYQVLNPHKIWLMVVLIVGISLGAYIIYKFFGQKAGTLAGGILGGLISSTATTVSYARRTGKAPEAAGLAALVIMVASTIVFARVLIIIGASAPHFLGVAAGPIGTVLGGLAVVCTVLWWLSTKEKAELPEQGNPSELKAALIFAGLYAVVLLAAAWAKATFGTQGLFVVAILSGLTDMDAITLSLADMVNQKQIEPRTGWRLILVAAMSNLVFKGATVAALGSRKLLGRIVVLFAIALALSLAVILFWRV
ncbi:MAG TPA: MgtC/SapB family protein [Verrucomicrobiae bacterium]